MLSNLNVRHTYQGNGSNTNFAILFDIMDSDVNETLVYVRDETDANNPVTTLKTYGALQDYTLSGASPPTTPFNTTVVFNVAPSATQKVILIKKLPLTQLLNLLTSGTFDFSNINHAFDRIVTMIQILDDMVNRVPIFDKDTQLTTPLIYPDAKASILFGLDSLKAPKLYTLADIAAGVTTALTASRALVSDSAGNVIVSVTTLAELAFVHGVTSAIQTQLDALTAAIALLFTAPIETQFTLANNQSASSITGLILDQSVNRSAKIEYTAERRTTTQGYRQTGILIAHYEAFSGLWSVDDFVQAGSSGLTTGVTFSIDTSTGQLKYATDNMSGSTYVGKLRYKIFTKFLKET